MVLSHPPWSITPKKVLRWVLRTGSEFSFDIGKWACDPSSIYIYSCRRQTGEWGKMSIDIHVILSCRALHDVTAMLWCCIDTYLTLIHRLF